MSIGDNPNVLKHYRPNPAFKESDLDSTERANLKKIRAYEHTRYGY